VSVGPARARYVHGAPWLRRHVAPTPAPRDGVER
jgi:hypothetical protein